MSAKRAAKKKMSKKRDDSAASRAKTKAKSRRNKPVGTCVVLMPFKEPFDTYYTAIIKPAVTAAKLTPLRGDSLFTSTPIMGDTWQMVQDAKVLVAELTGKNPNVFYELGLGHAIGKAVILVSESLDDVPFDLRPLRVLLYSKDEPNWGNALKARLTAALGDTLADTVNSVPPMFRKRVKSQAPADSEMSLRLSALEQQVASLAPEMPRGRLSATRRKPRSLEELRDEVFHLGSRKQAVAWATHALALGLTSRSVARWLKTGGVPTEEISTIVREASSQ